MVRCPSLLLFRGKRMLPAAFRFRPVLVRRLVFTGSHIGLAAVDVG